MQKALEGRYRLDRELGRGGMGIVYLAHELALDRKVALKLLPPALAREPRRRERFLREARTAARLTHPNIVPIFTVDTVGEFVFFTMAYVDGETLGERVRSRGPLPRDEATRIVREVAWAVAYAHAQGVIHCDLKAANILLERGTGRPMVTDFGIARVLTETEAPSDGKIEGTFTYMSPEQAQGLAVDERGDVYSLGIVGYFAATGRLPFQGRTVGETLAKQIYQPAPPLVVATPEPNSPLARAVDRCLAKQPDRRFQSAGELAETLEARREFPLPLRAFLNRVRSVSRYDVGLTLLAILVSSAAVGAALNGDWRNAALNLGIAGALLAVPLAWLLPVMRRVLRAGFTRGEMVDALRADLDRQREELAFQFEPTASVTERWAQWTAYAGFGVCGLAAALGTAGAIGPDIGWVALLLGMATTLVAGTVAAHRYQRRTPTGKRWLWFWKSRVGEWVVRLAGLGVEQSQPGAPAGLPRNEAAIARTAAQLFEQLPDAARHQLADLPSNLKRLEAHTVSLHAYIDELERAGLAEQRDVAQRHLRDTVTGLDELRRQVGGLRDGTVTVEGVTAAVEAAREIGQAVDRLLAARVALGTLSHQPTPPT